MIHNSHPAGSAAYSAIESRNRLEEKAEKVAGVLNKRAYFTQSEYNAAVASHRRSKVK